MLVAALVAAGAVVVFPQTASAAAPFTKTALYATKSGSADIVTVDRATGATTTVLSVPGAAAAINQLGISGDGGTLLTTDSSNVYEYTAATGTWRTAARTAGVATTMGGVDPKSGRYFYGGMSGSQFSFTSYDTTKHANTGATVTVNAAGAPGTNGDLAFDGQGNMYFVASSATSAQVYRVNAADLTGGGTATATTVGPAISAGVALNSMAFGDDGYLYIAGGGTNGFLKVNPITGAVLDKKTLASAITDLASNALPTTGSVSVTRPDTTFNTGDQFTVTIGGGGITTGNTATTSTKQPTATAGPLLLLPGGTYTIDQTAAGTTRPSDYSTTWMCTDPSTGKQVLGGTGTTGTFTIPAAVASVDCSFANAVVPRPVATTDSSPTSTPGAPVTVNVVGNDSGSPDPSTLRVLDPSGTGVTDLVVPGQGEWTVDTAHGAVTFTPAAGFTGNPTPVTYTVSDARGESASAQVVVTYLPTAADDVSSSNPQGAVADVDVTANDSANVDPTTVRLLDGAGTAVTSLDVADQGTWRVDTTTGHVTFTPLASFSGNPSPVTYRVGDGAGHTVTAAVTVGYATAAASDESFHNALGAAVTVDVTANDSANTDPGTVRLLGADDQPVTTLPVSGVGTWTVDPRTGAVTFTPVAGYTGDPAPVTYTVGDGHGHTSSATVEVAYTPTAAADAVLAPTIGDPVDVDVTANDSANVDPSTVRLVDPSGDATRKLVVDGEGTWTVDAASGVVTFTPDQGFTGNPAPVTYTAADAHEDGVRATVTLTYRPFAVADRSSGNALGAPVTVGVTANDSANVVPASVRIVGADGAPVTSLTVAGQGTWTAASGSVTFTPAAGYTGDPTPVRYSVEDAAGHAATATVTVAYAPVATRDVSRGNALGKAVTVDVVGNDSANVDRSTVRLLGSPDGPVTEMSVGGQGTWSVDSTTGAVTFTPQAGFAGNPTAARYTVTDTQGQATTAEIDVTYLPGAVDDASTGNTPGDPVTVDVTANDSANVVPGTVRLLDAGGQAVTELPVAGEGTWTVDASTGALTFTPARGSTGDPTPVRYTATDGSGDATTARVTVAYLPTAADDESRDHAAHESVTVDVTANDSQNVDRTTVRLLDAAGAPVESRAVDGEGTWTVDRATGRITFAPLAAFTGDPSPVRYTVSDARGDAVTATVTITYLAVAGDPVPATPAPTVTPKPTVTPAPTVTPEPTPATTSTPTASKPGGTLAFTGADLTWPGAGALALLLAGGALLLVRRRRGRGRHV